MSTLKPEKVSKPLAISGGWNAGEPWLVLHVSSSAKGCRACDRARRPQEVVPGSTRPSPWSWGPTSATPRSEILSVPLVVSSRLPGLMSLCTMPWLCRYSRPSTNWQKYLQDTMASWGHPAKPKTGSKSSGATRVSKQRNGSSGGPSGKHGSQGGLRHC